MDEKPKRRWFRFRLSTVLILTAIVASAMACRPRIDTSGFIGDSLSRRLVSRFSWNLDIYVGAVKPNGTIEGHRINLLIPARLAWPALALAAFLAWKAAWAVVERRRRQSGASE